VTDRGANTPPPPSRLYRMDQVSKFKARLRQMGNGRAERGMCRVTPVTILALIPANARDLVAARPDLVLDCATTFAVSLTCRNALY